MQVTLKRIESLPSEKQNESNEWYKMGLALHKFSEYISIFTSQKMTFLNIKLDKNKI